jgi:hypothetical protein
MIGREEFAEAARYADAGAMEHGFAEYLELIGVDMEGLLYVAEQRGLRAAMLADGQDPSRLSRTEQTEVRLSRQARQLMPLLQAAVIDGIAVGLAAAKKKDQST